MNFILKEMEERNADGVDFVPIWFDSESFPPIIQTMTKEEVKNAKGYPKTNRLYWKIENGKKFYCDGRYSFLKGVPVYDFKEIDFNMKGKNNND